jgi:glycosyltransferase involved in cell wall biosynthesis
MRIAFLWDGVTEHYGKRFTDGLYLALKHLEEKHTIGYFEPLAYDKIKEFNPDVLLYWAALCENTKPVVETYPWPKAIAFAGGPIEDSNVHGFDLYFTESAVNEYEFEQFGKPWKRAFGINEVTFQPRDVAKAFDACIWASFARWKRHSLFAATVGEKGIAIGQHQSHEPECYEICKQLGTKVVEESGKETVVDYATRSWTALNTADYWGGGQRMTLEAMAMNIPPIVMRDSTKNKEYVLESGYGFIVDPDPDSIKEAIEQAKQITKHTGRDYVMNNFTSHHYAKALEEGLKSIL